MGVVVRGQIDVETVGRRLFLNSAEDGAGVLYDGEADGKERTSGIKGAGSGKEDFRP